VLLYKNGVFIDNSFATGLISNFLFCNHIISLCSFSALCSFHFFFLPPLLDQHYLTKIKKNRGIHNNSKNLKGAEMQIGERKVLTWRCVLHYKHTECPQRQVWCARHAVVGPESKKHWPRRDRVRAWRPMERPRLGRGQLGRLRSPSRRRMNNN